MDLNDGAGEVREHDAPGGGVLPDAGAEGNLLGLVGDPEAKKLKGGGVLGGKGGDGEFFFDYRTLDTPID